MSSSSNWSAFAVFLRGVDELPAEALLQTLPQEVLERARGFQSLKRQKEFLWGRVLFYTMFGGVVPNARIVERAPFAPRILMPDEAECAFGSITHTAGLVAVMGAPCPCALDAEVMKPARVNAEITERVFGKQAGKLICEDPVPGFYRLWGLREDAVKMKGRFEVCSAFPFGRILLESQGEQTAAAVGFKEFDGSSKNKILAAFAAACPCRVILFDAGICEGRVVLYKTGVLNLKAF